MAQAKLKIRGIVQGVFYRDSARNVAIGLSLKGYAKNMPDGSVESLVIGERNNIEAYAEWCKEGSSTASVEGVEITWLEETEEKDSFEIY